MQHLFGSIGNILSNQLANCHGQNKNSSNKEIQPTYYPSFTYNVELIQMVQKFKYLSMNVSLQIGGMYYMSLDFE